MQWYYSDQGEKKGPVEESLLDSLVASGVVRDETLVWREGLSNWQTHASLRGPRSAAAVPAQTVPQTAVCGSCGRQFPISELVSIGSASICAACKPLYLQKLREGQVSAVGLRHYGGFWIRVVARLIDGVLLNVVFLLIGFAAGRSMAGLTPGSARNPGLPMAAMTTLAIYYILTLTIAACYDIFFIAKSGATPGKMLVGIKVIRADGSGISTGLSTGRYFAYWVSAISLGIGLIMAGFDDQKRALHDRICETRVIYAK